MKLDMMEKKKAKKRKAKKRKAKKKEVSFYGLGKFNYLIFKFLCKRFRL